MTDDLLDAVRDLPKCSPYLHVPAQSGSNEILARMKRGYTVEEYREMLARIRTRLPEAAVTSDFIVGFCGETEEDFQQTFALVAESRFKNSFIFKYSERPGTKGAERFADDIPFEVKNRRNNELLDLQNRISEQDSQRFLGQRVEVLVEGPSDKAKRAEEMRAGDVSPLRHDNADIANSVPILQLTGRTPDDRIVVFDGNPRLIGQLLPVAIYDVSPHTLFGAVVTEHLVANQPASLLPIA